MTRSERRLASTSSTARCRPAPARAPARAPYRAQDRNRWLCRRIGCSTQRHRCSLRRSTCSRLPRQPRRCVMPRSAGCPPASGMVTTACRATSMRSLVRTSRTYAPPSPHRWFVGLICVIRGGEKGLWKEKSAGVATAAMEGTEPKPSGASATSTGTEIDSTPEDGMGVRASAIDDETKVARLTRWRSRGRQYLFQSARLADTVGCTSPSRRTAPNRDD